MKKWIVSVIAIIIVAGLIVLLVKSAKKSAAEVASTPLGMFATCIKDSGATFYGAAWCPHCLKQKAMFEKAYKLLPYVECSPQQGVLLPVCEAAKIESFPTWEFADKTRQTGELTFAELAQKTSCTLPEDLKQTNI